MRKLVTIKDEIYEDRGKKFDKPIVRFTVAAVLTNPYAGEYIEDLSFLFPFARDLGSKLGKMVVDELGGEEKVETFGKAGIVGEDGELENITSILHGGLAPGYREYVGDYTVAKEYIEATEVQGPMGTTLYIPMRHKKMWDPKYVDTVRVCIPDAPRKDEMVIAIAGGNGPRPLGRTPPEDHTIRKPKL